MSVSSEVTSPKGKTFTRQEVAKHAKEGDLWIIVDTKVYDLSRFVDMHPGGASVLLDDRVAGKEASEVFFGLHRSEVLEKYKRYQIGTIEGENSTYILPQIGELSPVPYAEPSWLNKAYKPSPFYNEGHLALQREARKFFDKHVREEAHAHELSGERPSVELAKLMGEHKVNHMRLGPGKHLHGLTLMGGVKGEDFNFFHELILSQEIARIGARGYQDGLGAGMWIGLTPVMNYGSEKMKKEVMPPVLAGDKFICLAISEAFAGSDVSGMQTTAVKTPDGKHYIVNGTKKWITNGMWADWFSVGVVTGPGRKLSMLLIPRGEGVETKRVSTSYSPAAGTAYVTFDSVKVPVENLLGEEGKGLNVILSNFNHERWNMAVFTCRWARFISEECFKWSQQRIAFGKPLSEQAVVRAHLAKMIAQCDFMQAQLEQITHQMVSMTYAEMSENLAGPIALLKFECTRMATDIGDRAVQLFGGRGITRTGMGKHIEAYNRGIKFDAILGGSEEVLADLGVRQALRKAPKAVL